MIIVYKVRNDKIIGIARKADDYVLQQKIALINEPFETRTEDAGTVIEAPNMLIWREYSSNTWFLKPSFTGTEVVESITQQEIDDRAEAEEQRSEETIVMSREEAGKAFIRLFHTKVKRAHKDGNLTDAQYKTIRKNVKDVLFPLRYGDWDIAQDVITNDITPPTNSTMLIAYNFLKNKIDDYMLNNW